MSPEIVEESEAGAAAAPAKKSKKKLIIIGAAAAVLLLGGGWAGFLLLSGGGSAPAQEEKAAKHGGGEEGGKEAVFVDVPAMVVNLRSPDGAAHFLKIHFMLVPGSAGNEESIKAKLPLILDAYQPFLRELRPDDLSGSAATFRIKEELLRRAVAAAGADMVDDVLIQDLVQQ